MSGSRLRLSACTFHFKRGYACNEFPFMLAGLVVGFGTSAGITSSLYAAQLGCDTLDSARALRPRMVMPVRFGFIESEVSHARLSIGVLHGTWIVDARHVNSRQLI